MAVGTKYVLRRKTDGMFLRPNRGGRARNSTTRSGNWTSSLDEAAILTAVGAKRAGGSQCYVRKKDGFGFVYDDALFNSRYEVVPVTIILEKR